jgi:hypothetical protein
VVEVASAARQHLEQTSPIVIEVGHRQHPYLCAGSLTRLRQRHDAAIDPRISLSTVYRTLKVFGARGLVERIVSVNGALLTDFGPQQLYQLVKRVVDCSKQK